MLDASLFLLGLNVNGRVTVVGPDNGMSGSQFFLSGDEVEPTYFLSSGYNAANHTAEGMVGGPGESQYAPQLSQAVRDLLSAPCTFVIDATFGSSVRCWLFCDDGTNYIEAEIASTLSYVDNTGIISRSELGFASPVPAGRHRLAVTRTEGSKKASADGQSAHSESGDSLAALGTVIIACADDTCTIHEFTIYTTPVTDSTALEALSAL